MQYNEKEIVILLQFGITSNKIERKNIYFQSDSVTKGAKLVEVELPEEDVYIQTLAINLTSKSDSANMLANVF